MVPPGKQHASASPIQPGPRRGFERDPERSWGTYLLSQKFPVLIPEAASLNSRFIKGSWYVRTTLWAVSTNQGEGALRALSGVLEDGFDSACFLSDV